MSAGVPTPPRPLLILGRMGSASHLALRRVLRAKEAAQGLAVIDYQGALASALTDKLRGNLHKAPVLWCDLANRQRPCAAFRLRRTAGMKPALRAFLGHCAELLSVQVSSFAIETVIELAHRLCEEGSIGLAALARGRAGPSWPTPCGAARAWRPNWTG